MGMSSGLLKHSPLGASGASRWMSCPGSVGLSKGIIDEESEYAALGTAAHTLGEHCFTKSIEPWQMIGAIIYPDGEIEGATSDYETIKASGVAHVEVNKEMADAVQSYVDLIEDWHPDRNQGNSWVERKFHCPDIHELFYGTADFVYYDEATKTLHIWDYKHGAGIVVEANNNPQCMYYAAGALEDLGLWDTVDKVVIHIVQPRGWHIDGPHRTWEISTSDLDEWLCDKLIPAMDAALVSRDTKTGEHCRFCAARSHACPALMSDMAELQELMIMVSASMTADLKKDQEVQAEKAAKELSVNQIGRLMDLKALSTIVFKAVGKTAFGMLSNGVDVPGVKLVNSRTNREWKDGAEKAIKKKFGKKSMEPEKLKTPAQVDSLPGGKDLSARWAFKPEGAQTVAPEGDPRRRVNRNAKSLFKKQPKKKK